MPTKVFLSYANIKDLDGTVTDFHAALDQAIKGRFDMEAGVFMDKRDIRAGDNWRNSLSSELADASFLIILLSPAWLSRDWCLEEYRHFKNTHIGDQYKGLIIPLLWADTKATDAKNDEALKILEELNEIQTINWRDLGYDRNYKTSTELRRAIGKLADEIKSKIEASKN